MAILLKAQEKLQDKSDLADELYEYSIVLIERLLEVYESELMVTETQEIKNTIREWLKNG